MRKIRPGEVVKAGLLGILGTFVVQCAASGQTDPLALKHAQDMETNGQYALAASAYLAILEGYDFLPGQSTKKTVLRTEEKLHLGKRAIHCLGKGMKIHIAQHGELSECPEFHMLRSASHSMKQLEPQNPKWRSLSEISHSSANMSRLWLFDQCQLDSDEEALAPKTRQANVKQATDPLIAHK